MTLILYGLALVGFVYCAVAVSLAFGEWLPRVSYRWRKFLARRKGFVLRRWRLALGYRLLRPHIDAVHLWKNDYFSDAQDGRALGGTIVMERVREWRDNPLHSASTTDEVDR